MTELQLIDKLLSENNHTYSFHVWGDEQRKKLYLWLVENFKQTRINFYVAEDGERYIITYFSATHGRGGMDQGTPAEISFQPAHTYIHAIATPI